MSFKGRISRLAFAVGVAGLLSAQVPLSGGVAMADDGYNLGGGSSARVPIEIAVIGLVGYGIFSTFAAGGAAAGAAIPDVAPVGPGGVVPGDAAVYDVAAGNPDLSTFAQNADTAGLKDTLKDSGTYTVFAPTNAAFALLPAATLASLGQPANSGLLKQLLSLHIVPGHRYTIADLKALPGASADPGAPLTTLTGSPVYVRFAADQGNLSVSSTPFGPGSTGVPVTQTDISARNGILHPIGGVLPTAGAPATP